MDPARILADLSGLVVGKLVDDEEERAYAEDPFGRAFIRYLQEGPPAVEEGWRRALSSTGARSAQTAIILKRLTRDLLAGIRTGHEMPPEAGSAAEAAPANVRSITDALQEVPAFERADDGRWRPSVPSEEDPFRGYRRLPRFGSRYPTS